MKWSSSLGAFWYTAGWRESGARALVLFVLRECIWNALAVSLILPAFDDTVSLVSPPRQVVLWFHPGWVPDVSLRGIGRLS